MFKKARKIGLGFITLLLLSTLVSAESYGADKEEPKPPIHTVIRYQLPADQAGTPGTEVTVTQAIVAEDAVLGTAEATAAALNGGTPVALNEVIVVSGTDELGPTGIFALNPAAEMAIGADAPPPGVIVPQKVKAPARRVPYLLAQLRVWKKGAVDTGKNFVSIPFQSVALVRSLVAGGITYYGLVVTHQIPHELALRATLLSAGAAFGASHSLAFLKLWYNSLVPWEGLVKAKSKLQLTGAALYKGIGFITFYSYVSMLAVEVAKPGTVPRNAPEFWGMVGISSVYVLSQLFWGVKFLKDQEANGTSDANLNLKMGILAVVATAVLKYMAVDGPHYELGYAALIGSGAAALFWRPIKSWVKRLIWGTPNVVSCRDHLNDQEGTPSALPK